MKRLYLASPLGFTAGQDFREELHRSLEALGWEVVDPWDFDLEPPTTKALGLLIGRANFEMLRRCEAVLAVLDGADVDSGTACEVGAAWALGKRVFGIRTDSRRSGDCPALPVNLQVATAIIDARGEIVGSIEDLAELLGETESPVRAEAA